MVSYELFSITDKELDEMGDRVAAFTRFQVAEFIAKCKAEKDGEPSGPQK